MVYAVYIIFLIIFIRNVLTKESLVGVCICSCILLPAINGIDAANFVFVAMALLTGVTIIKERIIKTNRQIVYYLLAYSVIIAIQFFSWIIKNPNDLSLELRSSFAALKYPFIVFFLFGYECRVEHPYELKRLTNSIEIINMCNLIACIAQKIMKAGALKYFGNWYSYSQTYIAEITRAGRYYRAYGTWETAMSLGIYCLIAISVLIYIEHSEQKKVRYMTDIVCCVVLGILSLTKTFFIGIVIIIVYEIVLAFVDRYKSGKVTVATIRNGVITFAGIIFLVAGFQGVYKWSEKGWSHLHYYLGYVLHPFSAFSSRLSSTGSLVGSLEIIRNNLLIGVGSVPMNGELIGDNVYIVLLHAGGICALLIFLLLYGGWIVKCVVRANYDMVLVLVIFLLCGFSLPVGWAYKICVIPCILYLIIEGRELE